MMKITFQFKNGVRRCRAPVVKAVSCGDAHSAVAVVASAALRIWALVGHRSLRAQFPAQGRKLL